VTLITREDYKRLVSGFKGTPGRRRSKYGNKKVKGYDPDGREITLDSKREAKRYGALVLRQRAGEIAGLERQVRFPLEMCGHKICVYIADFVYFEKTPGRVVWPKVVEDAKGVRTDVYKLKKKMMRAQYQIEIRET
jgi:Protein of unknown function (DUF1064)